MRKSTNIIETLHAVAVRIEWSHNTCNGNPVYDLVAVTASGEIEGPMLCYGHHIYNTGIPSSGGCTIHGNWDIIINRSSSGRRVRVSRICRTIAD